MSKAFDMKRFQSLVSNKIIIFCGHEVGMVCVAAVLQWPVPPCVHCTRWATIPVCRQPFCRVEQSCRICVQIDVEVGKGRSVWVCSDNIINYLVKTANRNLFPVQQPVQPELSSYDAGGGPVSGKWKNSLRSRWNKVFQSVCLSVRQVSIGLAAAALLSRYTIPGLKEMDVEWCKNVDPQLCQVKC